MIFISGTLKDSGRPVAIKFVTRENKAEADMEFQIFRDLRAYRNSTVERFGFPVVYYYNRWRNFVVTAMTKLDESLEEINEVYYVLPIDAMILFRNFVSFSRIKGILSFIILLQCPVSNFPEFFRLMQIIQSKYMHSCGITHSDIHSENVMLRSYRSFLIGYYC